MRHIVFIIAVIFLPLTSRAQFFQFHFGGEPDYYQQREKTTPPEFKGGEEKLRNFQLKHFHNPQGVEAKNGTVVVACIVSKKGKVLDTYIVRGTGKVWNEEAMRVCRKMKFRPARQGKEKVKGRIDITFPIRRGKLSFFTMTTVDM